MEKAFCAISCKNEGETEEKGRNQKGKKMSLVFPDRRELSEEAVVFENEKPFAVIQFGFHEDTFTSMETFVAPEKRNQGKGSELLKELLTNGKSIIGREINRADAVIFPSNKASQKAFEKAEK